MRRGYSSPDKPKPQRPPSGSSGITPTPHWSSGTIRETCSCGASVSMPDTSDGRQYVLDWRTGHRHQLPSRPEPSALGRPVHSTDEDRQPAVGEIRDTEQQDVPFGFFPPVIEARTP